MKCVKSLRRRNTIISNCKTSDLFTCKGNGLNTFFKRFVYPWQILPEIRHYIIDIIKNRQSKYFEYNNCVLIGDNVKISELATVVGPAIIGDNTEIRPGAYIRENVIIGSDCVIGNSTELKNCILLNNVQVPHYNYVGDSILGNNVHFGAGTVCSNLKTFKNNVTIGSEKIDTGLRKVGAFVADGVDIGCGCVLAPGTVIGKNTLCYPMNFLRGVYPEMVIIKSSDNVTERRNNVCAE